EIPATVTFDDGSTVDTTIRVVVTDNRSDADKFGGDVVTQLIHKDFGVPTTGADVNGAITLLPNSDYKGGLKVEFDPADLPNGQTAGQFKIPVTITFDDGSTVEATVRVIVAEKPQEPETPQKPDTDKPVEGEKPEAEKPVEGEKPEAEKPAEEYSAADADSDKAAVLPETGEADNLGLLSAAAVSVLTGLGLVARRREED
ncbi:LPXTG cell wall anchor domain-containing protein, partial [Dolosicoccus paucivorans]|uniref:LPXTG cell wall anchor domain-containing protein n=1 Tax=Dolosicoccus paucivorans TaxID=84521 RepID=UPI00088C555A